MVKRHGILVGTHYEYPFGGMARRPEWLPEGEEDWRRDLEMIKDTGFDSIRIRIGFDSSLDEVGRLLDICEEVGIGVLFGFATFYTPYSFFEEHPDAKVVDRHGRTYPVGPHDYSWPSACINHPEYRRCRDRLVADCAKRFGTHPAVMDWDIHNEPAIGVGDHPCYCKHTVAKYQKDLSARFASVTDINQRWGKDYKDFTEVEPPQEINPSPDSFWRDWREFSSRNLSEFLLEGAEIIREHIPGVRVSFNYTSPYHIQSNGQDWWILPQLDYASASHYCWSNPQTGAVAGSQISLLKALGPDKEVWLTEFQGGPFGKHILWRGINIEAEVNQVFSHASHALYFYRWDPLMGGPEPWINGMVDADTYDTERRLATKRVIAQLRQYEDLIADGHTVNPRVGIYLTREMVWAASARGANLADTVFGLYGLFLDLGYEVSFVPTDFPGDCDLAVVAVPFPIALSETERKSLDNYMSRGGRMILEFPMTSLEDCQEVGRWPGLQCREWIRPIHWMGGWSLKDTQGQFGGFVFFDRVLLDNFQGQVIASYRDNDAPGLICSGSEGRLLIPTFPLGRSYHSTLHSGLRRLLKGWLPDELAPDIDIQGMPEEYRSLIEARVVESAKGNLLFVINRSGYDWDVEVAPRGYQSVKVKLPTYGATHRLLEKT